MWQCGTLIQNQLRAVLDSGPAAPFSCLPLFCSIWCSLCTMTSGNKLPGCSEVNLGTFQQHIQKFHCPPLYICIYILFTITQFDFGHIILTLSGFATMLPFVVESDELLQAKMMARALGQRTHSCSMERQATVAKNVLLDMREQKFETNQ